MKRRFSKTASLAAVGLFALATSVNAHHLPAPTNVLCPLVGEIVQANWDDVVGATKYSVNVVASYDTGIVGDTTDDTSKDWDFGTGDRTDGLAISQSELFIPLSALNYDFGTGLLAPMAVQLRVKGLHPGKNQERQNNLFSDFCFPAPVTM